ncbi:MAG: hypothetical protein WBM86_01910 [Waterburya sp.]
MNNKRIRLGEWEFGDRLRTEKDPVKSQNYILGARSQLKFASTSNQTKQVSLLDACPKKTEFYLTAISCFD